MINTDLEHFNYEVREDFDIDDGNDDGDDEFEKLQNYIHEHAPPSERYVVSGSLVQKAQVLFSTLKEYKILTICVLI